MTDEIIMTDDGDGIIMPDVRMILTITFIYLHSKHNNYEQHCNNAKLTYNIGCEKNE